MRYLYIVGFTFLFFVQSINAQFQGYYSHDLDSNRNMDFILRLYSDSIYSLTWDYDSDPGGFIGHYIVGHISCGNWRINQEIGRAHV